MQLSRAQQRVVDFRGHCITAAPPGSGKTRVMVAKAQAILAEDPVNRVTMVTFTKAAANEMRERVGPAKGRRLLIGTFDSLCLKMAKEMGLNPHLASSLEMWIYAEQAATRFGLAPADTAVAREAIIRLSSMTDLDKAPEDEREMYAIYEEVLRAHGRTDFGILARDVVRGLRRGGLSTLDTSHLIVDEFQDSDDNQVNWVIAHARAGVLIDAVGDDDQSIYGFRGALGARAMKRLQQETGATMLQLDTCYRCRDEIIAASKHLISANSERIHKPFQGASGSGGLVHVDTVAGTAENQLVLDQIKAGDHPRPLAVLARSNDALRKLEIDLRENGIPFDRVGGQGGFWDRPGPQAMLALIEGLLRGRCTSTVTVLLRVIGVARSVREEVVAVAGRHPIAKLATHTYTQKQSGNVAQLLQNCAHQIWSAPEVTLSEMAEAVAGERNALYAHPKSKNGSAQSEEVLQIAAKETELAAAWLGKQIRKRGRNGMGAVVQRVRMLAKAPPDQKADVVLSTLHGAKGLEWPSVWIIRLDKGQMPAEPAREQPGELDLQGERRLLYVGMTRAQQCLYLTGGKNRITPTGQVTKAAPSCFLAELCASSVVAVQAGSEGREPATGEPGDKPSRSWEAALEAL